MSVIERIHDNELKRISSLPNTTVIRAIDTPPTATKEELWSGSEVRLKFLMLLRAREEHDSEEKKQSLCGNVDFKWRSPPERARAIVNLTGCDVKLWVTFRRIYKTFWVYALAREGTTQEDVRNLCGLTRELDEIKSIQAS